VNSNAGAWLTSVELSIPLHIIQSLCRGDRRACETKPPPPVLLPTSARWADRLAAGAHVVRVVVDERARGQVDQRAGPVVAQVHRDDPAVHVQDAAGRLARLGQPLGARPPPHVACAPRLSMACAGRRRRRRSGVRCTSAKSISTPYNCRDVLRGLGAAVGTHSHATCCTHRTSVPVRAGPRQSGDAAQQGRWPSAAQQSEAVRLKVQLIVSVSV